MGTGKKEKNSLARQRKTGDRTSNVKVKGENFYRSAKKAKRLNRLKDEGKPTRNKDGKVVQAAAYQSKEAPTAVIEPNRRWFNNTRVISQDGLKAFQAAIVEKQKDPYSVLLQTNKLPMSLIRNEATGEEGLKKAQAKITIETVPYAQVFGPKSLRKRVKIPSTTIEDLAGDVKKSFDKYETRQGEIRNFSGAGEPEEDGIEDGPAIPQDHIFSKGKSKRIWNELYKVIDASDVILHVLDARDPEGTRCRAVEKYLLNEAPHKHHVFILNKIDLVPTRTAADWIKVLQRDHPTCAMRASIKNSFGRGSLIDLLRQYAILHKNRKQISCGLIGYPNAGKSSVINTLRSKAVVRVAPIPGETKVWQYVTLTKRIYLIDCPGIVPPSQTDTPEDLLLRAVVRIENVDQPEKYVPVVLNKVKTHHMERTYHLKGWKDHEEFLSMLAKKTGRLLKGGECDLNGVAKMVINDFNRGKIPWFTAPPALEQSEEEVVAEGGGRLGEMSRKRKREDLCSAAASGEVAVSEKVAASEAADDEIGAFSSKSCPGGEDEDEHEVDAEQEVNTDDDAENMIPLDDSSDEEEIGEQDDGATGDNKVSDEDWTDEPGHDEAPPAKKRGRKG